MRFFMTGATGLIGRAVAARLRRDGHDVAAWVRTPARARAVLGDAVELVDVNGGAPAMERAVAGADGIVNLAGEPLVGRRWTAARRRALEESRVGTTRSLVRAIGSGSSRPAVLVSGSAVGVYGDRGDEPLTERSSPGHDFLARLCREWEAVANEAAAHGVRVVNLRTSVVLDKEGGALAQMLPPFRLGLGGPIGSGRQFFPWIHRDDLVNVIATAAADSSYVGPINAAAPQEATSRTFAAALGRALGRPAILPVPAFALKAIFGEAATVLLASQRVVPQALADRQFRFAFPALDAALADVLARR
jgi:uncharacterized protein (TIGR01777 family)